MLILLVTLMLSLSRGAWVGTAVALLFMLIKLREARRLLIVLAVPLVVVGFFVWSLTGTSADVKVVGERARAITVLSPYDDRRVIYREAYREIRENPVLGVGPGGFPVASTRVVSESATLSYAHAHNLYLNWAAEVGLPSVVIILCFAFSLALSAQTASRGARVRGDPRDRTIVIGLSAASDHGPGPGILRLRDPQPRRLDGDVDRHRRAARCPARGAEDVRPRALRGSAIRLGTT